MPINGIINHPKAQRRKSTTTILLPSPVSVVRNSGRAWWGDSGLGSLMWLQSDSGWSWNSRGAKGAAVFFFFFFNFLILFIFYFWLCWVFVSVRGLSLVVASGGHSSSWCAGLSLSWPLLLRSTGSRRAGSVVVAHGPSCSVACGIFPDRGSNPCPLHWQADSQPLHHQGSPQHMNFRGGVTDIQSTAECS